MNCSDALEPGPLGEIEHGEVLDAAEVLGDEPLEPPDLLDVDHPHRGSRAGPRVSSTRATQRAWSSERK